MTRYINADKLYPTNFEIYTYAGDYKKALEAVYEKIDNAPAEDVTPVVHANWVKKKHLIPLAWDSDPFIWENYDEETHSEWKEYWHCSECDYEADRGMKPKFKYCPECGAKMEE